MTDSFTAGINEGHSGEQLEIEVCEVNEVEVPAQVLIINNEDNKITDIIEVDNKASTSYAEPVTEIEPAVVSRRSSVTRPLQESSVAGTGETLERDRVLMVYTFKHTNHNSRNKKAFKKNSPLHLHLLATKMIIKIDLNF